MEFQQVGVFFIYGSEDIPRRRNITEKAQHLVHALWNLQGKNLQQTLYDQMDGQIWFWQGIAWFIPGEGIVHCEGL